MFAGQTPLQRLVVSSEALIVGWTMKVIRSMHHFQCFHSSYLKKFLVPTIAVAPPA